MRNRESYKGRALLALGAAIGLGVLLTGCGDKTTRIENTGSQLQNGISVTGQGKVSGKPDLALLSLGVTSEADTVQVARDRAATALDGIIKSLKSNGVDDKDIQTQQLSIQPQYDYNNGNQRLRGFQVMNIVTVKLRDINKTSKAVDDSVTAGGNETTIQSLAFTIDDPEQLKQQARENAVADAKAKAETLAKVAGVKLGGALQINESSYSPGPMYYARDAAGSAAADTAPATPIQAGELDVLVDVNITWAIE